MRRKIYPCWSVPSGAKGAKDLIVDIDKGEDDPEAPDDINLVFTIKKIKSIKTTKIIKSIE